MPKSIVITQPCFFPWIGFFEQIRLADIFVHYDDVQFVKRSFQDRVQIKTKDGFKWLTATKQKFSQRDKVNEILLSDGSWREDHLVFLQHTYQKAPFVDEMVEIVADVYRQPFERLSDLSIYAIESIAGYYGLTEGTVFHKSSDLDVPGKSTQRLLDVCLHYSADLYITAMGALKYFDFDLFEEHQVKVHFIDYQKKPYPQLDGVFNPYVSILDLIANTGRDGIRYICSESVYWQEFIDSDTAKSYLNSASERK